MGRAILVGAAPVTRAWFRRALKKLKLTESDVLIGVDGGVATCLSAGLAPHFAIGDWDSLVRKKDLSGVPALRLRPDKDRSDLAFALELLKGTRASEILCFGVSGSRLDHELGALMDLASFAGRARGLKSIRIADERTEARLILPRMGKTCLGVARGATVSVFAWGGAASGVMLEGFRYPLRGGKLLPSSHGLSNQVKSRDASVGVRRGTLLVVIPQVP